MLGYSCKNIERFKRNQMTEGRPRGSPVTVTIFASVAYGYRASRFILSVWFGWFIRLVWFNQTNETDQMNQRNQLSPRKHDRCE